MSAVIVTLMQHHWVPIRHTSWKDPEGNRWTLKAGGVGIDDWGFWQAFRASIEGQLWEKAARHELGAGLDGEADLTTLFKHDKFLERRGLHAARGMLLASATASCWTQERRYRAGLVDTPLCPRCEEADEDMFHRVWQCRANTGEIFDKTQHLVQKATQAKDTFECFWLRGVVPRSWTLQDTKLGFWRQFGSGVLTEACTYIFGDGSGTHSDPRIRRVGWSAVIIQGMSNCLGQTLDIWKRHSERLMNSLKPAGGWMGTLGEGEPNTVGRAELMACVVAAESTRGNVVYVTDYKILKKRQDRGWPVPRLGQGSNPDLWWRLSRALKTRQGTFTVQWQRAHIDVADIKTENHDMAIVLGNEMADAVAMRAASEAAVRGAAAEQIAWVDTMAWQVQRRIIRSQESSIQNCFASTFRADHTSIGISTF